MLSNLGRLRRSSLRRTGAGLAELRRLQRGEVAELLRLAVALKDRMEAGVPRTPPFPGRPVSWAVWTQRARVVVELCRRDRAHLPGLDLLQRLAYCVPAQWPAPPEIARAACGVEEDPRSLLVLGAAVLRAGDADRAAEIYRSLARRASSSVRWRAFQGLAYAHLFAGRARLALGAIERAADEPASDVSAFVDCLLLSSLVGDQRRLRRAAARLDFLVDPSDPRFVWALSRANDLRTLLGPELRRVWDERARVVLASGTDRGLHRSPAQSVLQVLS